MSDQYTAARGLNRDARHARQLAAKGHGADVALPHDAGVRAVVLPPAILEEYKRKFGATFPMALPDIAFDQDRQRALIRYNFGWRGGSLLAERKNGRWTITEAINENVPAPVIAASLFARFGSRDEINFAAKVAAALRNQFGGHAVRAVERAKAGPDPR